MVCAFSKMESSPRRSFSALQTARIATFPSGAKMMEIEPGFTLSFASFFARTTSTPKMELGQCGLEAMMTKSRPGGM